MVQAAHFTSCVDAGAAGTGAGSVLAILRQAPLIKYSIGTGISTAFCIGFYGCKRALILSHASRIGVRRVLNIRACCLILLWPPDTIRFATSPSFLKQVVQYDAQ